LFYLLNGLFIFVSNLKDVFVLTSQDDYERRKTAHENSVAECRHEMTRLLAAANVNAIPVNEELIRKKYSEESKQIKV